MAALFNGKLVTCEFMQFCWKISFQVFCKSLENDRCTCIHSHFLSLIKFVWIWHSFSVLLCVIQMHIIQPYSTIFNRNQFQYRWCPCTLRHLQFQLKDLERDQQKGHQKAKERAQQQSRHHRHNPKLFGFWCVLYPTVLVEMFSTNAASKFLDVCGCVITCCFAAHDIPQICE